MENLLNNSELEQNITKASLKTCSYLLSTAEFALNNGLPICLASAWSSKAKNSSTAAEGISNGTRCLGCGINLRNRRCFDLKIEEVNNALTIMGICCGCKQKYYCGEMQLPSCSDQSRVEADYVSDTSISLDRTFDERSIRASSTPLLKSKKVSTMMSPRISNSGIKAKRDRKRRGSALERLLKEEESETDHSLSGFLNMVAKY
ncbi:hypothetical protein KIN20_026299 [Parelaphostrongylus tenuis]|uniref:Uncharacterized protein n=1 Tax=Parelaphostrongylus tenuis TaxID=148309 RepID=A0AAD5MWI6_PARTN|nr:hypothetical protein KIN20_026299 [Parelaphostrongylus tenuis]